MSKVLGLDLGTGMSCVAVIEVGKPVVVVNEEGTRTTPSVVQITKDEVKIGNAAKRAMVANPKNTISFVKRLMGADFNDENVKKMQKLATYDIVNKSYELGAYAAFLSGAGPTIMVFRNINDNTFNDKIES